MKNGAGFIFYQIDPRRDWRANGQCGGLPSLVSATQPNVSYRTLPKTKLIFPYQPIAVFGVRARLAF